MPVHDLLGGKMREAANVYVHADGPTPADVADRVKEFMGEGYRFVRVQQGLYGGSSAEYVKPDGAPSGAYFDPVAYQRDALAMIDHVRGEVGPDVELVHDVHERLPPADAVGFAKAVEPYGLYFLEDLLAPEDLVWFERVRSQCTTPLPCAYRNPSARSPIGLRDSDGSLPARTPRLVSPMYCWLKKAPSGSS